jgi:hypothetical protein
MGLAFSLVVLRFLLTAQPVCVPAQHTIVDLMALGFGLRFRQSWGCANREQPVS